ncbi:NAD(P)-dependent oxidoreductase [Burkholderia sp. KCJ3K979]|uniref:NAD-binding protein n=1 Tax=Burkholderia sp. KCJ3K979 TaxID=2759149 RepID=UPI001929EF76|nr:NAD-binding protein [Burkholderia sp. KCJ3K979]MBL3960967.1 NAD(P)-dependent oxidoreductase [Burkholderia sp. KCJ3K979]
MDTAELKAEFDLGTSIGFIGLGAMGAPMARHLARQGYRLLVNDFNRSAVDSVVECGAQAVASAREVADQCSIVLLCLPSLPAIRDVLFGDAGVAGGSAVRVVVDFSTTGANFAQEVAEALADSNIALLDSPITGNVTTAGNGTLGIMCSGPRAAYEKVAPVMATLASAMVLYLGEESGKAQTLKLLNNLLSATGMASTCEAFILGVKGGLAPRRMLEVINSGDASSSASRNKFARSVLPRRFDFGARMAITAKDISLSVEEAQSRGVPMWVGQAVQQIWKFASTQGGYDRDGTSLITYLEPWAGVEVCSPDEEPSCRISFPEPAHRALVLICAQAAVREVAERLVASGYNRLQEEEELQRTRLGLPYASKVTVTLLGVADDESVESIAVRIVDAAPGEAAVTNMYPMAVGKAVRMKALLGPEMSYCDALHTGTQRELTAGDGVIIVGGDESAIQAAGHAIVNLCRDAFHMGSTVGAAHLMLNIHTSLFATLLAVTSEAYVAGAKAGLTPEQMAKIMGIETGRNAASSRILPGEVATRKFNYGLSLGETFDRLTAATDEARQLGVTTWIFDKVRGIYGLVQACTRPTDDVTTVAQQYERWAGVEVRSGGSTNA